MTKTLACQESTVAFNSGKFRDAVENAMAQFNIKPLARLVMYALLRHAHNKDTVFPSIPRIIHSTGLCKQSVLNHLSFLEKSGFLIKGKTAKRNGLGNKYTILIPQTGLPDRPVLNTNQSTKCTSTGLPDRPLEVYGIDPNTKENTNKNISEIFEKFFQAHPRHDKIFKKAEALKAYTQALQKTTPAILGLAVLDYAKARRIEIEKDPENRKYTLSVQSWLNKEKWKDVGSDGLTAEQRFALQEKRTQENKKLEHSMEEAGERNEMIIRVMRKIKTIRFHIRRYYDLFSKEYPWENTLAWEEKFEEFALSRENLKNAR
jgi:hypothetical protein